ncbi:hypothetical protein [Actinomadura madurae]|uniref:hypothetical protein n=1 Tax=Actinomadura madurae TaxID=1993 RepID=UPI0020D21CA4|nr:hypothetical protein [Actinomadura madurae]MCQ0014763.1 hypothetical protein [Actinomadura madurae]
MPLHGAATPAGGTGAAVRGLRRPARGDVRRRAPPFRALWWAGISASLAGAGLAFVAVVALRAMFGVEVPVFAGDSAARRPPRPATRCARWRRRCRRPR